MRITLTLELDPEAGALIRTLGLVERRGHRVLAVSSVEAPAATRTILDVDTGDRSPDLLVRQLERLLDVRSVRLEVV